MSFRLVFSDLLCQSVSELAKRLEAARTVAVVGNGGIALELVHTVITRLYPPLMISSLFFIAIASLLRYSMGD